MNARSGVSWIYDHMTRGISQEQRDVIDAALGDDAAAQRSARHRMDTLMLAGGEVG